MLPPSSIWEMVQEGRTSQLVRVLREGAAGLSSGLYGSVYGSVYKGPGVSTVERQTWREELEKGNSTQKLAAGNAPGRSQLAIRGL